MLTNAFYYLESRHLTDYFINWEELPPLGSTILIPPKVERLKPNWKNIGRGPAFAAEEDTRYERLFCDLCANDGAERMLGKPISGDGTINGFSPAEYFVLAFEPIVTSHLVDALRKTDFRGYSFYPYNLYNHTPFDQPVTFGMHGLGNIYDLEARRNFRRQHPTHCVKCHWGPATCPGCLGFAMKCPLCGSYDFEYETPIDEIPDKRVAINYPWGEESHLPLNCECWDGLDFLSGNIVSGRVAKWLVENQYGPIFLQPYPADETKCTPEQLQRIEEIRFPAEHS